MKKNYQQKNMKDSGFTLVETLVAISIFTLSILALLSVISQGIANTTYAKNKIIASYLAQEGIEYVRNIRDTYVMYNGADSSAGWSNFRSKLTGAQCQASNGCYFGDLTTADFSNQVEPIIGLPMTNCGSTCPNLLYDSASGKYGYTASGTTATSPFIRTIKINLVGGGVNEIQILSTVSWTQGSGTPSITFSESVFNWVQ